VVVHERGGWGTTLQRSLASPLAVKEQWFGIYYRDQKVGFTHLLLMPDEQEGLPGVSIIDDGRLRFSLLGVPQLLRISARTFIDVEWRLRSISATVESEGYRLRLTGTRRGDNLLVTLASPTSSFTQRLEDPADRIWLSGLSSWAAFHELKEGQRGHVWILNLLTLSPEPLTFHVTGREAVGDHEALVIETSVRGLTATTWMTPDGVVLKETSPMGWTLRQEPMHEALAWGVQAEEPLDLLSTLAVPVNQPIPDPAGLQSLTVLIEGIGPGAFEVDRRPWQEILSPEALASYGHPPPQGPWTLIQLRRPSVEPSTWPPGARGEAPPAGRYRLPGPFLQSDDPAIIRQARAIVGSFSEPWPQAQALQLWVYQTLAKQLTVGWPSATDVLASKSGDCHEHTVLFTALARSLGIPTRMVAGLVSYQDRFYYHAWPEVWVPPSAEHPGGGWLPLDPTLGESVANPTHLGLVEADGEHLLSLAQVVGQLRLHVLELEP
jgi:hypothetical protein